MREMMLLRKLDILEAEYAEILDHEMDFGPDYVPVRENLREQAARMAEEKEARRKAEADAEAQRATEGKTSTEDASITSAQDDNDDFEFNEADAEKFLADSKPYKLTEDKIKVIQQTMSQISIVAPAWASRIDERIWMNSLKERVKTVGVRSSNTTTTITAATTSITAASSPPTTSSSPSAHTDELSNGQATAPTTSASPS